MKAVWFVYGDPDTNPEAPVRVTLFETKYAAEVAARLWFPNENPDQRYCRIHYVDVLEERDLK